MVAIEAPSSGISVNELLEAYRLRAEGHYRHADGTQTSEYREVLWSIRFGRELYALTGMRPGEVCRLRLADADRSAEPWVYRPVQHKTPHHGKDRAVMIGPKGRKVIEQFIADGNVVDPTAPLFSPRRAREERFAAMREKRKTRVQPSQVCRRERKPVWQPAEAYSPGSYSHAIAEACDRAFPLPASLAPAEGETVKEWEKRLTDSERAHVVVQL